MPVTLKPIARGILRRRLLDQLTGVGDVYLAVADDQWGTAQKLRRRYENCMRVLDDLGWREDDPAEEFAITMETVPLMRVLARLHEHASEEIERHVERAVEERLALWEAALTVAVRGDVLIDLVEAGLEKLDPERDDAAPEPEGAAS